MNPRYPIVKLTEAEVCRFPLRKVARLFIFFVCMLWVAQVHAGNKTWTGAISQNWNHAGNWNGGTLPLTGDDIIINPSNYTNAPAVQSASLFIPKKITITNGGMLTIQASLTTTDVITVDGAGTTKPILEIQKDTLTISNGKSLIVKGGAAVNFSRGTLRISDDLYLEDATFYMSQDVYPTQLFIDYDNSGQGMLVLFNNAAASNPAFSITGGLVTAGSEGVLLDGNNKPLKSIAINIYGGIFLNKGPMYFNRAETDNTTLTISGGTVTLMGDVRDNAAGKISINLTNGDLIFMGNLSMESGDVFTQTGGTITFSGINKDWTNDGVFNATAGTVTINDPTMLELVSTGTWNFHHLTINPAMTLKQTGPASINVAGDWNNKGTFTHNNKKVTFNGSGIQNVSATTFYQMTVAKSGSHILLTGNVTVANMLTMSGGNIDAGAYKITLGTSTASVGTLTHTGGTIIGKFERWIKDTNTDILFPVGTSAWYRPETLRFVNLTSGSLTVEFVAAVPGNSGLPLSESSVTVSNAFTEGYWSHSASGLASTNYKITLVANGFTSYVLTRGTRVLKRTSATSPWVLQGSHQPLTASTAQRNTLSGVGTCQFALGRVDCKPYNLNHTQVNVANCYGDATGSIDLNPAGGLSPYVYQWSNGSTTEDISGLAAGPYTVTTTDDEGCTATKTITITQPSLLNPTGVVKHVTCTPGSINLTPAGGTPPYTFTWSTGATTEDVSNLTVGNYSVTVKDNKNCTAVRTFTVNNLGNTLVVTISKTSTTVVGGSDGTIDLTPSSMMPPFTFLWNTGHTTEDRTGLAAGTYRVTTTDAGGCSRADSIKVLDGIIPGTKRWEGDVSYQWNDPMNWEGNALPSASENIIIDPKNYFIAPVISANSSFSPKKVDVLNAARLTIQANLTATDKFEINGQDTAAAIITMSAGTLTVANDKQFRCMRGCITNFSGGSIIVTGHLEVEDATFNMSQTTVAASVVIDSDNNGSGKLKIKASQTNARFNMAGGTVTIGEMIEMDGNGNGKARSVTLDISDGTMTSSGPAYFRKAEGDSALIKISGGSLVLNNDVQEDPGNPGTMSFHISGGSLTFRGHLKMESNDRIIQTGGTITFDGSDKDWVNAGTFSATGGSVVINDPIRLEMRSSGTWNFHNLTISSGRKLSITDAASINVAGNWTNSGGTFEHNGKTVIFNGSSSQNLSAETFYNLTVNKPSGNISLTGNVVTANELSMTKGNIITGANKITLGTSAASAGTLNYAAGTVIGKFERWISSTAADFIFPVGVATYNRMATLRFNNLTSGSLIAEFIAANPGVSGLPVWDGTAKVTNQFFEGYWRFTAANALASTDYNMKLDGAGMTSFPIIATTRIIKRTNAAGPWTIQGTHADAAGTTARRNGFSGFSDFALGHLGCITFIAYQQDVSCNGANDGAIDLYVAGGTEPYTYAWSNGATTQDLSGLAAGTYTVTVTDATNCSITTGATITQPGALTASVAVTQSTNYTAPDGSVDLTMSGGTPPYSFQWSNGATTEDITGLLHGNYPFTVTDSNACTVSGMAKVGYGTPLDTFPAGSFVINMGVTPQTYANGLKPYGLVFALVKTYKIPVSWVINPAKTLGGKDFTYNAVDYKGGPFIIHADFISPQIDSVISAWRSLGVVGFKTTSSLTVPVFHTIKGLTNVVIDQANEGLIIPYFNNANFPTSYYSVGLPLNLNDCSDSYILPHADPTWADHKFLRDFVTQRKGYIWSGCHAVSVLEGIHDPGDVSKRMNFLSSSGLQCYGNNPKCGSLITEVHAGAPALPYIYDSSFASHPIMQAMGNMTSATQNGSEEWYIPLTTGRWNLGASLAIATSNGSPPRRGAKLVFGRAYDVPANGLVMYQGGHRLSGGTEAENTAAQRAFFNFIYLSSIDKGLRIADTIPSTFVRDSATVVSAGISQGSLPYTYKWSSGCGTFADPTARSTTFTVNPSTSSAWCYITLEVTDACGRFSFEKVKISMVTPNAMASNYNGYNVSCYGASDGSIDLSVQGGTPPYSFAWSTGETIEDISGLPAGTYMVTVTDAYGYWDADTVTLTQPVPLTLSIVGSNIACGAVNGSADLTVSGGVPSYSYSWSSGHVTQDISGLAAGWYYVTVSDLNGCFAIDSVQITQSTELSLSAIPTNLTCNGGNNGKVTLTITGGAAPYSFNWSNGKTTQTIDSLAAGTYNVTVTDADGCTATAGATVLGPSGLAATTSKTDVSCHGGSNGSIDLTLTGGTAPFTYNWSSGQTTQDISGLSAGTYTVTVTDNNSCTITAGTAITEPAALTASTAQMNVSCYGGSNGSIDLTVSGGTAPFTYNWSSGQSTQDISGLIAGSYNVTVTDAKGCTAASGATVTQPAALSSSITKTDVTCNGAANGSISLSVGGGVAPYSFSWSNGQTSQDISSLTPGTYNVTVTDANGCTITNSATITQPAVLSGSITKVNVSCFGGSNGSINLTVSGGTAPYGYSWSHGATTEDVGALQAGAYQVTITDAKGCTATASAAIAQPAALSASSTKTDVSCFGGNNGSIDVTVTGGTLPYSYAWSHGAATQDVSGLTIGSYTMTVTDANGCTATTNAAITQPAPLATSLTKTDVDCNGNNSGSIDLSVSGGTSPYSYVWSNGPTTQDIASLPAGNYFVTVTDANGCTITDDTVIIQPAVVTTSVSKTSVSCFGGNNGSVNLSVSGGTPPYSYIWSNGKTTQDIDSLAAGTYNVTVTDASGCTALSGAVITQPAQLTASTSKTDVTCHGGSNGFIDLTVSGGTASYWYAWSHGPATEDVGSLAAGTYNVTVTDASGCTATSGKTIAQPAPLNTAITSSSVSCHGGNDGSVIALTVTGGSSPYSYNWSNGAATQLISGLFANTYRLTVTDAKGCTKIDSALITQPAELSAFITPVHASCYAANDGSIDLSVAGGNSPYHYNWSNGQTTQDIDTLSAGVYGVTITDDKGCTAVTGTTISQPPAISISASTTDASCNGGLDGAIDATVSGGTSPFSYLWSTADTVEDIANIASAMYSLTVTDGNSCVKTASIAVGEASALTITLDSLISPTCNGSNDAALYLSVSGGIAPYYYNWSTGDTTQDISGLSFGSYTVTVTDSNFCSEINIFSFTSPLPLLGTTTKVNVSCHGGNNGSIDLSVSGGTPPYAYNWSNGAATQDISGLTSGTYHVTITDDHACTATAGATIAQPTVLTSAITHSNVSCHGGSDGSVISLTASGGTPPYSYLWSTGATTRIISGLTAATYQVTVTDAKGCTRVDSVTVTEPPVLTAASTQVNVSCEGGSNGSIDLSVSGGTLPYSYAWSNGATTQDISNLTTGTYHVTITDAKGCSATQGVVITQPAALADSVVKVNVSCSGSNNGSIDLTISGGTPPYTYNWSTGASTQDVSGLSAGTYGVTTTDASGCVIITSANISQPASLSASTSQVNVSCHGGTDGSINLTVSGGTTPYSFSWSNSAATEDLSGLAAASYTVTVTDANSCTVTRVVHVTQPAVLAASITFTNVSCHGGNDGSVMNLVVSGGTSPYTYLWSTGATTQNISSLAAGTYRVTVTDAKSCMKVDSVTITEPPALALSTTHEDVGCHGGATGSIDLTVSGGTPPYAYNWSTGAATQDISGLAAGTYHVTVTDDKGCMLTTGATISEPSALAVSVTKADVSCFGFNDGSIDVTVSGGTSACAFSWSNGKTTQDIDSLAAGTYHVTITDAQGCTATASANVTQPSGMTALIAQVNASCNGFHDGSLDLTVWGGTTPYSYFWNNAKTTQDIDSLGAGHYNVTITDAKGCSVASGAIITEPAALTHFITQVNVSCYGGNNGLIDLTVSGGTAPFTYNWSNGPSTQDISSLTIGTYNATVTDANGCSLTAGTVITQPDALAASAVKADVSCNGGSNGIIDLTVSGGTAPYVYLWSNGRTTQDIDSLGIGTYTATVTDANGCTAASSAAVSQPAPISASTIQVNVSCYGGNNGSINLTVSGGTAPYMFLWSTGAATKDISSLAAGTYTVTITDAKSCTATKSATIIEPSLLTASVTKTDVSCFGGNNGSIDLTVSGGTSPFSYLWTTGSTNQDLGGIMAGTYNVTVTDGKRCTAAASATVTQPAQLIITETHTDVSCNGWSNGSIDVSVTGGTAPYTFLWNTGATTEDISLLPAATYRITVTDARGCFATTPVVITAPQQLTTATAKTNAGCNGSSDGAIDLTVNYGMPPYTFIWSNGAVSEDISGLAIGTYSVTVTDSLGCSVTDNETITQPATLTATTTHVNASCNGLQNGSIDLTVSGGTAPYTYSWTNGAATQDINSLAAGTYSVTISDANNCVKVTSATVAQPPGMAAASTTVNVSCNGSNSGAVDLTVSGGTAPYVYNWSNGKTTQDIDSLIVGIYWVTVTDAQGCSITSSDTITEPALLASSFTKADVSCVDGNDGSIDLSVWGGTSPYAFNWSNGATTEDIFGLLLGKYTVIITDARGCKHTRSITISQPTALTVSAITTNISCNGYHDGSIDLTVFGGSSPYLFNWSNVTTSEDQSGLSGGNYTVTVTDNKNCTVIVSAAITEPEMLTLTLTANEPLCFGCNNGSVTSSVSGGTPPYSYLWDTGDNTPNLSRVGFGNYCLSVTDAHGCEAYECISLSQPDSMHITRLITHVSCIRSNSGSIDITVNGGVAPYIFSWSNGASTEDIDNLRAGNYSLTVTDANGITRQLTARVNPPEDCNNPPVASDDINNTLINMAVKGNVLTNDDDPDGNSLFVSAVIDDVDSGSLTWNPNGTYTYTPASDFKGQDRFIYVVCDNATPSLCDTATVHIGILTRVNLSSNDPPVANADDFIIRVNGRITSGIMLANDYDPDGDGIAISAVAVKNPSHGTATMVANAASTMLTADGTAVMRSAGKFNYDPMPGFIGQDRFIYLLCDNGSPVLCDTAIVTIHMVPNGDMDPLNLPPVALDDAVYTDAGVPVSGTLAVNDYDSDGDDLIYSASPFDAPDHGSVTINVSGAFTYSPAPGYFGPDNFIYVVCDNGNPFMCDTATAYVVVRIVNNAPLASDDINNTLTGIPVSGNVLTNDSDPDDDNLVVNTNILTGTLHGDLTLGSDGSYTYIPNNGYAGEDKFQYAVCDNGEPSLCDTAWVYIEVLPINPNPNNNPPVANADDFITYREEAVSGVLLSNDYDIDNNTIAINVTPVTNPGYGSVVILPDGSFTYTPNTGFTGEDQFQYSICDDGTPGPLCDIAVVTLHVLSGMGGNRPPVAVDDAYFTQTNTSVSGNLLDNDYDPDGNNITVAANPLAIPSNGTVSVSAEGTFTYTPDSNYAGPDHFTYVICDDGTPALCDTATVYFVIPPVYPCPHATPTPVTCPDGSNGAIDLRVMCGAAPFTYLWSNGATTEDISGIPAGTYSVTVTDPFGNAVMLENLVVAQPAMFNLNSSSVPTVCGMNNGKAFVNVSGGTPAYTYLWSTGETSDSITGLSGGIYRITVTDMNGCQKEEAVVVNTYPSPDFNTTKSDVTCYGGSDGAIWAAMNSGTPPYTYIWIPPVSIDSFAAGLPAGTYVIVIYDSAGCNNSRTVGIIEPDSIKITMAATVISCTGGSNGALDATVSGGVPPYTYLWSTGATTEDISGLSAGSYTLTVTDASGCMKSSGRAITQPAAITVSVSGISDAKCYGQASGFINITVSGGAMPYTFQWSNGATTEDLINVAAGSYSVTVTDRNLCTKTVNFNIGQPASAMAIAVAGISDVRCHGQANGYIHINVSGGVPPYTYLWSHGATTKNVGGLAKGSYSVTVTDANGCRKTGNFNIGEPPAMAVTTISANDAACYGQSSGSIDISVSGGTPPFHYQWSQGAATEDISGVPAGNYTVTVTDAGSCTLTKNFSIGQPADIAIAMVNVSHVTCHGDSDGAIDIAVTGGIPGYTYAWSHGATTEDANGMPAGNHAVTITDSKGCIRGDTFSVTQPAAIDVTVNGISDATCYGEATGYINTEASGGTPPYMYSWSHGAHTKDAANLSAGSYRLTVTDMAGCTKVVNYNIGEPAAIAVNASGITHAKCFGDSTGTITLATTGGTPPYRYSWSSGAATSSVDKLTAGTYSVTAEDNRGCRGTQTFVIHEPSLLAIEAAGITHIKCSGDNDGAISVSVAGGTQPYSYTWSNGAATPAISSLSPGTYRLTVADANNCRDEFSADVRESALLEIHVREVKDAACHGSSNGSIDITVSGGQPPYQFSWSNGAAAEDMQGLAAGEYTVSVSDASGCTGVKRITVSHPAAITSNNSLVVHASCRDRADGRIELSVTGGAAPYTFRWTTGATSSAVQNLTTGSYGVIITDMNGCSAQASFNIGAPSCNHPPIAVDDTVVDTSGHGLEIHVMDNDSDPDDDDIHLSGILTSPAHGSAAINSDGTVTYKPEEGYHGPDYFTYIICDDSEPEPLCDTATVFVNVLSENSDLFIPSAISPNRDDSNEYWEIRGIAAYPENEVVIFNRWGNEVYKVKGYNNTWNGVNHKGEPLPDGTYYYILKLNDKYKSIYTGYVVIFRG